MKNSANKNESNKISLTTCLVLGMAVIYVLIGFAHIFMPQFQAKQIIYIFSLVLMIFGLVMIIVYFLTGGFKNIGQYGFSGGLLCMISGILMLTRVQQICGYLLPILGICIMVTAIVKLQNAIDMKSLDNIAWIIFFVLALFFIVIAVLVILNPAEIMTKHENIVFYVLIADGFVSAVSLIYLAIAIRMENRDPYRPEHGQKVKAPDPVTRPIEDSEKTKNLIPDPENPDRVIEVVEGEVVSKEDIP